LGSRQGFAQELCKGLVNVMVETLIETGIEPVMVPRVQLAVAEPAETPVATFPLTERIAELELDQAQVEVM